MKTTFLLPVFFLLPFFAIAQNADSTVIKQVDSLIQVSRALTDKRDFNKALEVNAAAETLALEKLGRESAGYGSCCYNRGRVNYFKKDNPEAEKWYLDALDIWAKSIGKEHPDYARCLDDLAIFYHNNAEKYEKAEPLYLEAIAIFEKTLGKEHADYVQTIMSLAQLYSDLENNEKAEPLYLEVKNIREKTLGKENPLYAESLVRLGIFYENIGNFSKAEPLLLDANAIQEKATGRENPRYVRTIMALGLLYQTMGNDGKAEPFYLESKAIYAKILGTENPNYAMCLNNLANVYTRMGIYEKAEQVHLEVKAIRERTVGKEHSDYAMSLMNLAILYRYMGKYDKSEQQFLEAKTLWEKTLGKESWSYISNLSGLGKLYEIQKRVLESDPLQEEIAGYIQSYNTQFSIFFSEREISENIAFYQLKVDEFLAFALGRPAAYLGKLPEICFNNALFYKGFLLQAARRLNKLAASNPEAADSLKGYYHHLAAEYVKPVVERKHVDDLEEKAAAAEKELIRSVAGYAEAVRQVNWQEVRAALKMDEAAIEFVHFGVNFPKNTDSIMYAALLLLPGTEQPHFILLLEEKQLDSLLQRNGERSEHYVKQLYSLAVRGVIVVGKPPKTLYELLWKPLEKELNSPLEIGDGIKTIYYSPSGLLHRLNLAAIPINLDSVLGDRYQLVELGSTRQLVVPNQIKSGTNDALLFGGIQYDSDSTAILKSIASMDSISVASRGELNFFDTDSTLRVGTWGSLPFTAREVGNLERILKTAGIHTQTHRGYVATEEAFKTIGAKGKSSPRILHIATHGFFFPDSDHPMIRSGLLLAGANHAWKTGKPLKPGMEDGILTAYEISQMNLSNTELVVLSACETGLGDIQGNEGVYGLQRAFKIAGAKYLIMSLWQVPDKQTSLLMTTFYKKWLPSDAEAKAVKEQKMTIPEAFRAAQKELRDAGLDPYQWAGFVLVE
jgi:CHAT domain-containing protein